MDKMHPPNVSTETILNVLTLGTTISINLGAGDGGTTV